MLRPLSPNRNGPPWPRRRPPPASGAARCAAAMLRAPGGIEFAGHRGVDEAGRERIDGDAERSDFPRQRAGEAEQRRLARAVDRQAAIAGLGDHRGHVDDPAAPGRHHRADHVFRSARSATACSAGSAARYRRVGMVASRPAGADAGVVDQAVERRRIRARSAFTNSGIAVDLGEIEGEEMQRAALVARGLDRRRELGARACAPPR